MEQTARRQEQLPGAFNGATTNSQHGRVRWYLVHTPNGKERETCEKVRRIIPHELMQDAFVMQKEFWFKQDGAWSLQTKPMYKEYFFVATHDAAALDREDGVEYLPAVQKLFGNFKGDAFKLRVLPFFHVCNV